ncbi:XRE family transcriptional regulator [Fructobacillus papyrifericola]|uniref:XRE family transcriptional regulator n=1 Tax=Fructobacillus papyrifericola TaxID=2713172 RepID=A0ABS5QR72_9LACO|nr:XRE family transcriptional regulator [Fructobacillus papyrifericola]MBS9335688.1 XRE family transcriptional regulator [Fructobacillus papyrifericola]
MKNIFGTQLVLLRQKKKLSQEGLAKKLFVSRQSISKWENGEVEPGIDKLILLAEIFAVDLDYLLVGKSQSREVLLESKHLSKSFDSPVLKDINLSIHSHERIALLGSNGSGKSTLVNLIVGLSKPDAGEIIRHYNPKNDLSIMPQDNLLVNTYRVNEQVALSAQIQRVTDRELINQKIRQFNLESQLKTAVGKLSGGQKRRLCLLIAMLRPVKLLILDEPTVGMDLESIDDFWDSFEHVTGSVLTITHDFNQIDQYFTRVLLLKDGVIAADELVANIHSNNQTIEQWYRRENQKGERA